MPKKKRKSRSAPSNEPAPSASASRLLRSHSVTVSLESEVESWDSDDTLVSPPPELAPRNQPEPVTAPRVAHLPIPTPPVVMTTQPPAPDAAAGRYIGWAEEMELLSAHNYCSLVDLRNFVHTYMPLAYSVHSNRARVLEALKALRAPAPFAETVRYPARGFYVDLNSTSIAPIIATLMCCCDCTDRATNVHGQTSNQQTLNDVRRSYEVNFAQLQSLAYCTKVDELARHGIMARATFESTHEITWQ